MVTPHYRQNLSGLILRLYQHFDTYSAISAHIEAVTGRSLHRDVLSRCIRCNDNPHLIVNGLQSSTLETLAMYMSMTLEQFRAWLECPSAWGKLAFDTNSHRLILAGVEVDSLSVIRRNLDKLSTRQILTVLRHCLWLFEHPGQPLRMAFTPNESSAYRDITTRLVGLTRPELLDAIRWSASVLENLGNFDGDSDCVNSDSELSVPVMSVSKDILPGCGAVSRLIQHEFRNLGVDVNLSPSHDLIKQFILYTGAVRPTDINYLRDVIFGRIEMVDAQYVGFIAYALRCVAGKPYTAKILDNLQYGSAYPCDLSEDDRRLSQC